MKLRDNAVRLGLFLACALLLSGCSNGEAASELTLQDQVEIIEAHEQLRNDLIALLNVERAADEQITSDDSLDSVAEFAAGVVLANPGAYPVTDGLSEPLTNLLAGTAEEETPAPAPAGKQRAADPAEEDADEAETPDTQLDESEKAIVKSYETGFVRAYLYDGSLSTVQFGDMVISDLHTLKKDLETLTERLEEYGIENDGTYNRIIASLSVARLEEGEQSVWLVLVKLKEKTS